MYILLWEAMSFRAAFRTRMDIWFVWALVKRRVAPSVRSIFIFRSRSYVFFNLNDRGLWLCMVIL